jgi:tetratricopeptide (TPR) repeat protein
MKRGLKWLLPIIILLIASVAQAKTASEVFEAVSPSIVVVHTFDAKGEILRLGSGVVLPGGMVATNYHVLKGADHFSVLYKRKEYSAALYYSDADRDVCTLTISGLKVPTVILGDTTSLKVGSRVYAIGAPQGLELTLSEGIISSLRPAGGGNYLQFTAPISSGSSGGGLFSEEGKLIGLTTFYMTEGQQLNFAVPVEWVVESLKRHRSELQASDTFTEWRNKAAALEKKGDWLGLIDHELRWTRAFPQDASAWYNLGLAYGKLGQTDQAINAYRQSLRISPEDADAWHNLGSAYDKLRHYSDAIKAYQQSLHIKPEDASVWSNLGIAYDKSDQTTRAIEALQRALHLNPEYDQAWWGLGTAYNKSGQFAEAIEAYKQALLINPENSDVWSNLGCSYVDSGQTAKAINAFQKALRINTGNANAWYGLGVAYRQSGQTGQVMEVYQRLKTIDPTKADQFFDEQVLP